MALLESGCIISLSALFRLLRCCRLSADFFHLMHGVGKSITHFTITSFVTDLEV
jgi:hypothetical protein